MNKQAEALRLPDPAPADVALADSIRSKLAEPGLSPLSEPPQNVEVIRKPRKEKPVVVEDDTEEG